MGDPEENRPGKRPPRLSDGAARCARVFGPRTGSDRRSRANGTDETQAGELRSFRRRGQETCAERVIRPLACYVLLTSVRTSLKASRITMRRDNVVSKKHDRGVCFPSSRARWALTSLNQRRGNALASALGESFCGAVCAEERRIAVEPDHDPLAIVRGQRFAIVILVFENSH